MPPSIGSGPSPAASSALSDFGSGQGQNAASSSPSSGIDQQRAQLQAFMGRLRELDQHIEQVFTEMPALAPLAQQMKALIKRAITESVGTGSPRSSSGESTPTASQ
jgi:hypothetical protein